MIKENDCVEIEFNAYDAENKALFDTTSQAVAKKYGLEQEEKTYNPITIIVGKGFIVKGVDESLIGKKEGDSYEITIPAEKGFGLWSSKLTENIRINTFIEKEINPVKGMFVNIDDRMAKISFVGDRLVKVDYNHPLCNKSLLYEVKIKKIIEDEEQRAKCVISNVFGDNFKASLKGDELKIKGKTQIPKQFQELIEKELKEMLKKDYKLVFETE
ncbi:MAG: FKBP-type peptidyl-prolyl cis-trans isomerase [Candidatus Nanoarchaeia archaeon]|jgi:FKBP-type peptidyl-prolyl cis-trans isomerase SlyD